MVSADPRGRRRSWELEVDFSVSAMRPPRKIKASRSDASSGKCRGSSGNARWAPRGPGLHVVWDRGPHPARSGREPRKVRVGAAGLCVQYSRVQWSGVLKEEPLIGFSLVGDYSHNWHSRCRSLVEYTHLKPGFQPGPAPAPARLLLASAGTCAPRSRPPFACLAIPRMILRRL
jgi:hypothetical protein